MSFERERAASKRKDLDAERKALIADLDAHEEVLRKTVTELASDEQRAAAGSVPAPWTTLDLINALTMYGLVLMGVCLVLGLFGPTTKLDASPTPTRSMRSTSVPLMLRRSASSWAESPGSQ